MKEFLIENGILMAYRGMAEDVIVPRGVTEIGAGAFFERERLRSVEIPDSVTWIEDNVFLYTKQLTLRVTADSYAQTYA